MRQKRRISGAGCFSMVLMSAVILFSLSAQGAFLYKSYIVRKAGNQDILCDPYIVQKDDYVLKIFRQRGEISHADFPEFLNIFEAINPQVKNIDKILPGQHIFIPLKKLEPDSVPDQEFGIVTIPFVTGAEIEDILRNNSDAYRVRQGDTVSELLSVHFGKYGTDAYEEGLSIFKAMNPHIEDVNFIVTGQQVWLPQGTLRNQAWYESLFDSSGNVAQLQTDVSPESTAAEEDGGIGPGRRIAEAPPLERAARILDGKVYQKGTYYFPRPGKGDFQLNLAKFPVLELKGGSRVLVSPPAGEGGGLSDTNLAVLRTFWKGLAVAELSPGADITQVLDAVMGSLGREEEPGIREFTDGGVHVTFQPQWMIDQPKQDRRLAVTTIGEAGERTPKAVLDYLKSFGIELKEVMLSGPADESGISGESVSFGQVPALDASADRKAFVRDFYGVLGAAYEQNVSVSFPYAGVQIEATTNLLTGSDGFSVLIDFGDLQGDAAAAIERTGLAVLQILPHINTAELISKLLDAAGMTCETDPVFSAAERTGPNNTTISLPGFLARKDQTPQVLLATVPVHDDLVRFFRGKSIDVVTLTNVSGG